MSVHVQYVCLCVDGDFIKICKCPVFTYNWKVVILEKNIFFIKYG